MKFDNLKCIKRLFDPIEEDEVQSALQLHVWKTSREVLRTINRKRSENGRVTFGQESGNRRLFEILTKLKMANVVDSKKEMDLTQSEKHFSNDLTLKSPDKQAEIMAINNGNQRSVWKLKKSGIHIESNSKITAMGFAARGNIGLV